MKRQLSTHAQAAKEIRQFLKSQGLKAKVKSDSYSMGSSVDIYFTDQDHGKIAAIRSEIEKWKYGNFNCIEDIYEDNNHRDDIAQVKYVIIHESYSDELKAKAWLWYRAYVGDIAKNEPFKYPENHNDIKYFEQYSFFEKEADYGSIYEGQCILRAVIRSKTFRSGYKPKLVLKAA